MPVKLHLYKKILTDQDSVPNTSEITHILRKPSLIWMLRKKSERLKFFLWYFITFGNLKVLYIIVDDKIAHYSYILPPNYRFPFMTKGDLQIGPCYTSPEFRGKGYYAYALNLIPHLLGQTKVFWIYTAENNLISKHVIEKCGFIFQKSIQSHGFFRILR